MKMRRGTTPFLLIDRSVDNIASIVSDHGTLILLFPLESVASDRPGSSPKSRRENPRRCRTAESESSQAATRKGLPAIQPNPLQKVSPIAKK